jgi:N-acetylglucosaminyl-diphospho-decaprenol L-rhamnosyltransferase
MTPNFSIIVVGYNKPELVERCLASVMRNGALVSQTKEVILVNNGPQKPRLPAHAEQFIKVINSPKNIGFGAGVNLAAQEARGEYLLLLNPDAQLQEATISELTKFIRKHPKAAVVGARQVTSRGEIVASFGNYPNMWREIAALTGVSRVVPVGRLVIPTATLKNQYAKTGKREWVSGGAMVVRRDVFERVDGFDPGFFLYVEDIDFCRRVQESGGEIWFSSETVVTHDYGATGSRAKAQELNTEGLLYYAKKYHQAVRPLAIIQNIKAALR